jgi:hypothetical protein
MALIAVREGDEAEARALFQRVLTLAPRHEEARRHLDLLGVPPERSPLILPDTVELVARTSGERFEVFHQGAWHPFYVKGMNVGAALPGRFPSEFPDSLTYADWLADIAEMDANVIRVYTIHPPHFYAALAGHNRTNPDRPLWLIHGVWTGLPPDHDFGDSTWNAAFTAEMRRVVDVLHGQADLPRRPGHAAGFYTADVSRWTLAYIIGREWEPFAVAEYDRANPDITHWKGRYLELNRGSATDVWLAEACERLIAYETEQYRQQRPVAYTSWPTLDPLHHPTETTVAEEMAFRRALGGDTTRLPKEYDNDLVAIDPTLLQPTAAFRAGVFAAYHAYPYYPDLIVREGGYARYLRRLKHHHRGIPLLIAEYGVPASIGVAHLTSSGWHHGGHTEREMARINADLTRLLARSGMAGGILFAWIDEWFKKSWLVIDVELPRDRSRMWLSRLNPEQQYGMIAVEPVPRLGDGPLATRLAAWNRVPYVYDGAVRMLADEAYLHVLFETPDHETIDTVFIGLDVLDRHDGQVRWPGRSGPHLPVGIEFALVITPSDVRVLADPNANPFRLQKLTALRVPVSKLGVGKPPPGTFTGPYEQVYNLPRRSERRVDGRYDSLRVVTNRRRFGRDSTEYAPVGHDRSVLLPGTAPDGSWEVDSASRAIEVRIPWTLINVADPSSRQALGAAPGDTTGFLPVPIQSIGVVAAMKASDGTWLSWPSGSTPPAQFTWEPWDEPQWRARRRPAFDTMRRVFLELDGMEVHP